MPFNPFSALTSKLFGGAALALLLLLAAQTIRANHWHKRADQAVAALETTKANYRAAQAEAQRLALAARKATEALTSAKKELADASHPKTLSDALRGADSHIAAHRLLPAQGACRPTGATAAAGQDRAARVPVDVPADPVVLGASDVRSCAAVTAYAIDAFRWAQSLREAGLAR